jgi:hypothetical protein
MRSSPSLWSVAMGVACLVLGAAAVLLIRPSMAGEAASSEQQMKAILRDGEALQRRLAQLESRVAATDRAAVRGAIERAATAERANPVPTLPSMVEELPEAEPDTPSPTTALASQEDIYRQQRDYTPWARSMEASTPMPHGVQSFSCRGTICRLEAHFEKLEDAGNFFDAFEASPVASGTTLVRIPPDGARTTSIIFIKRDPDQTLAN